MDIKKTIIQQLAEKGEIKVSDIAKITGFSRVYIHRYFRELQNEGRICITGKANRARYVLTEAMETQANQESMRVHRMLRNNNLAEDRILDQIKSEGRILTELLPNIYSIFAYAFTEILNNSIEHSQTDLIDIVVERTAGNLCFNIYDRGIGIFNNIMSKKGLKTHLEAIQDLLKGKQTTAPDFHSGEGIYFTSKIADRMIIKGSNKSLIFDNIVPDVFIKDLHRQVVGTRVSFKIRLDSIRQITSVFNQYTNDSFEFSKTEVKVKLFREGVDYVSRSQARRILTGLEKFKTIELDFAGIKSIGQGFADEIFRVWKAHHANTKIVSKNIDENTLFMIKHVVPDLQLVNNS
jgi:anti-sigma regulatory factor (Ser/Thr protein kinase)